MNTVAAHAPPAASPAAIRSISPFPTTAALALERATHAELELAFLRGATPDVAALVGWQFRGINHPSWARLAGIKKFVKGFFKKDGAVMGYNCAVEQNVLDGRWHTKPSDAEPRRFGFYEVVPVDATARDNAYLHAVLLDYGRGGNAALDPMAQIRDYVVQVTPDNPDLYLGKAYLALGPLRVHSNFFILERFRRAP
ncbi:MAG: hypothetical protein KIT31_18105 [Deltaproteobacteria bacterium]|nr:hypothetical protein [Deltaproteobacteria bacterium]